jgi:DNA-directed RNA polymerase specialized sigma24 family protein
LRRRAELARHQEELAQVELPGAPDVLAIARRLRDLGVPSREAAQLVGVPESTLRSRLKQAEAA